MTRSFVAVLSLLLLSPACQSTPPGTIFEGGTILTLDPERPRVEALLVRNGEIAAVGTRASVAQTAGANVSRVDLAGGVLIPALVDHHVHLFNLGMSLLNQDRRQALFLDLAGMNLEQISRAVEERASVTPPGGWILGQNWSQGAWGTQELPAHQVLTQAAADFPVFLTRVDGHAAWLNQAALELAGIGSSTPNPPGGAIVRGAGGEATGVVLERAAELVTPLLPPLEDWTVRQSFRRGAQALSQLGIVRVQDAGFLQPPGIVDLSADLEHWLDQLVATDRDSALPLDVELMVPAPSRLAERIVAGEVARQRSPRVRVTHLKLYVDGALGSRGAWLTHAYRDDSATSGFPRMTEEDIQAWAGRALDVALDVAVHAIGDAAVKRALNALGQLLESRPDLDPKRLRIEHFSYASQRDIERAGQMGLILTVQPGFVGPGSSGITMEDHRVGPEQTERVYALRRLVSSGAVLAGSSDYFSQPLAPLAGIFSAATRQNFRGEPDAGWHPGNKLDRSDALLLFTRYLGPGGKASSGMLSPGEPADLALLSGNPLDCPPLELLDLRVVATWRRGVATFP